MKLNKGDKVIVRLDLEVGCYGIDIAVSQMLQYKGEEVTIREVVSRCNGFVYKLEGISYNWTIEMFDLTPSIEKSKGEEKMKYVVDGKKPKTEFKVGSYMGVQDGNGPILIRQIVKANQKFYAIDTDGDEQQSNYSLSGLVNSYESTWDKVMLLKPSKVENNTMHFEIVQ